MKGDDRELTGGDVCRESEMVDDHEEVEHDHDLSLRLMTGGGG